MEEFSKSGRKLRPRKQRTDGPAYSTSNSYHAERTERPYSDHKTGYEERNSYSGNYGQSRSYGQNRNSSYGEGRSNNYGQSRGYGENRNGGSYGRSNGYGQGRSSYGDGQGRSYGQNRSNGYGDSNNYGRSENYGQIRSYGENRNGGSYGRSNGYGQNRGYGARPNNAFAKRGKPAFSKKANFKNSADDGMNKMLSRKPVISPNVEFSDNDYVKVPIQEEIRLNKFIANSGVCSRREADTFIQAGVVTVNGEVVTELGTKVNIYNDEVKFNGERLKGEEKVYLVMNKPKGYVTTASDPHADKTVMELIKGCPFRVFPVGRLDKNTTGVLMFTNDGELAEKLTHPSYDKKKIYQVSLNKPLSQEDYEKILEGIELTDGRISADELEFIDAADHRKLGIEIHSGKNRIVRRMFEASGYEVKSLDRVYFAGLTKKGLKKGEWRRLSEGEVNILKMGAYV